MDSKKYNNTKLFISISKAVATFIILFLFVASGLSRSLEAYVFTFTDSSYIAFLLFMFITFTAMGILFFPVNFYSQYILEHKYNLSNQTFFNWLFENLKGLLVSLVIGIPVLLFFYYSLINFGSLWWLPFAAGLFVLSVLLARVVPIFILPLFYKVTPIDNDDLKSRIESLAADAGIKVENVFRINMSKNTKKANAAFTGIGRSKRILLGDTLLENYSGDEIETVIAHEFGHYKKKHIIKNIIIGTVSSFLTLFLLAVLYKTSLSWFGFNDITRISAIPLLSLWGMLIGIIQSPLTNLLSRKYEYEADEYAVKSTGKTSAFKNTLEKLTDQNLGDKDPHPFVEWFFYSHPSVKNRLRAIDNLPQEISGSTV
jgi:STE24 endopeptidase